MFSKTAIKEENKKSVQELTAEKENSTIIEEKDKLIIDEDREREKIENPKLITDTMKSEEELKVQLPSVDDTHT